MHPLLSRLDRPGGRVLIARALEWQVRRRHGIRVHVGHDPGEGLWVFRWPDVTVPMVEPTAASPQEFEDEHADVFFQEYEPVAGDVIVDLGAGMGTELDLMCRLVGPTGRVYAVEADPLTFRCLELRREWNSLENAVAIHAAVTDETGEVSISSEGHHLEHRVVADGAGRRVPAVTLDDLASQFEIARIDLLKINIEGAERMAFEGMRRSIDLVRNVAVSCHDFIGFPTADFTRAFLVGHGFTVTERRADDDRDWARSWLYARRA
jgi:FkbM family methyltransferase